MLFLYILSLLYLTQRVVAQVTSESEAINKIINDILIQTEERNREKQNDKNENTDKDFFWSDNFSIVHKQRSTQIYYIRNSNKRKIEHSPLVKIEKTNPTLKLHDILPELNNANTNSDRVSRKYSAKETTTKPTKTTKSQSKVIRINQTSKMKAADRKTIGTTPVPKKKPSHKTTQMKNIAITDDTTNAQISKKPALDVYSKNIPTGPQERQFSKGIFKTPKVSTADMKFDKVTKEQQKISSLKNTIPQSSSKFSFGNDYPKHDAMKSKSHSTKTFTTQNGHYPFTTITEKEWSSLKDAEDLVKSIPDFKTTPVDKYPKITNYDNREFQLDQTDKTFKYSEFIDGSIDDFNKYTTLKQLDKRITEDIIEKLKHLTIGEPHKHHGGTVTEVDSKQIDKLDKKIKAHKENPIAFNIHTTYKPDTTEKQRIGAFKEKAITTKFGDKVTEDGGFAITSNLKDKPMYDITFKPDEPVTEHSKYNEIQHENINTGEESLDEILRKFSAKKTTGSFKNNGVEMDTAPVRTTEKNDITISPYDDSTSASTIDQYLLESPKDESVTSYFTIETTTENVYDKLLIDLGIRTTPENVADDFRDIHFSSTIKSTKKNDNNLSELYKDVIRKYETIKDEPVNIKPEELNKKVKKRVNWERIKKFFGHDRVCKCTCKANKTMCTVCAAGDAVMRELVFEFNNLADYMNTHCTEIQTFFWMNPSGGKKLRDAVHKIDSTMQDYYKRVKGKCAGRTCQAFSTYLDRRRYSDKMKLRKKYLDQLLRDLEVK